MKTVFPFVLGLALGGLGMGSAFTLTAQQPILNPGCECCPKCDCGKDCKCCTADGKYYPKGKGCDCKPPLILETVEPELHVNEHLKAGQPERLEKLLIRKGFVTLHDGIRKVPSYSAWHMTPKYLSENPRLSQRAFRPDPDLPPGQRAELSDYRRSGFDRGHMAPSHDMRRTKPIQAECFYLSNMVPQDRFLNQNPWRELEEHTRVWIRGSEDTYIVTGPVFGMGIKTIGRNRVAVPQGLFKVIACKKKDGWHAIGFVCENGSDPGEPADWITPIGDIEMLTGFRFLTGLPASDQARLRAALPGSLEDW